MNFIATLLIWLRPMMLQRFVVSAPSLQRKMSGLLPMLLALGAFDIAWVIFLIAPYILAT
jgi:hypothetical protein